MTPRFIEPDEAVTLVTSWLNDLSVDINKLSSEEQVFAKLQKSNMEATLSILSGDTTNLKLFVDSDADYTSNTASRIIYTLKGITYNAMPPLYRDSHWVADPSGENLCWMFVPVYHMYSDVVYNTSNAQTEELKLRNEGLTEVCRDCGNPFAILIGEQLYMKAHNLAMPKRCKACRASRKLTLDT